MSQTAVSKPQALRIPWTKSSWVFSLKHDLVVFWALPFAALLLAIFSLKVYGHLASFYILSGVVIQSHIFSTWMALWEKRAQVKQRHWSTFIVGTIAISIIVPVWIFNDKVSFYACHFLLITAHTIKQMNGWLSISIRKADQGKRMYQASSLCLWAMAVFPIAYGLSELVPKDNFHHESLYQPFVSGALVQALHPFYWLLIFGLFSYIVYLSAKMQKFNLAQILLLGVTFVMHYFPLVIFKNLVFSQILNQFAHSCPYLSLNHVHKKKQRRASLKLILFLLVVVLAVLHVAGQQYFHDESNNAQLRLALESLLWVPIVLHYLYDSFLWKNHTT